MLYKNTKAIVCSCGGGTDFLDIVSRVLKGDAVAPYLFILYLLCMSIDLIKENMMDANYAEDLVLLANTTTQTEYLRK